VGERRVNPLRGGGQKPLQSLEKLRKYKGGSKRHDGSLACPKDVAVKPFSLKGFFNVTLSVLVPILARRSNGFLGGHVDLYCSFPSLEQDSLERVLVIEIVMAWIR
jgi:hypothetical protein